MAVGFTINSWWKNDIIKKNVPKCNVHEKCVKTLIYFQNEWPQQGPTNEWPQQGPTNEWAQGLGPTVKDYTGNVIGHFLNSMFGISRLKSSILLLE